MFRGITPEPPFKGKDRRGGTGRDGKEGKGRAEEGRGRGSGMGDGLKPPVTNSWLLPCVKEMRCKNIYIRRDEIR